MDGERFTTLNLINIAFVSAVLGLFYWSIYVNPPRDDSNRKPRLTVEKSQELLQQSRAYLRDQKYEEALPITRQLHEEYPDNHIFTGQLAEIMGHLKRNKEEADLWEKYFNQSPTPIEACPQFGQAYEKLGLIDKAIEAHEKCLELGPRNPDSLLFLGLACERAGKFEKAMDLFERGLRLSPRYSDLSLGLARAQLRRNKVSIAKSLAGKVLKTEPHNVDALLVMGMVYRTQGNFVAAKKHLEQGVRLAEKYTDFYIILGGIAEQEGNAQEAIKYYNKVLELDPEKRDIAERRDRLAGGRE